ncbi:hypothetical protein ACJMK2_020587, partial [Sinanodonta woodiana]
MKVCDSLLTSSQKTLPLFDQALIEAQSALLESTKDKQHMKLKKNVHARIMCLPICPELTRTCVPRTSDVGSFLSADIEQCFSACKPLKCPNEACNAVNFVPVNDKGSQPVKCRNYQEVKIQEQVQKLAMGTIPRSMWVVLEDDLVDGCKAGDDVIICGTVMRRWRSVSAENRCDIEIFIRANHVQVMNEQRNTVLITQDIKDEISQFWEKHKYQPLTARNHILASLCPQVYGLYVVKLAVAMVLARGVQRVDESGTCVRGEIHMLLVGDP